MKKTVKKILFPLVLLRRASDSLLRKYNPELLFSIYHKRATGRFINYRNPRSLNDKIAFMEFRTDTTEWSRLADKVRVRDYVKECGYEDYLTKLYGVYEHADEIDYDKLPKSFVLKTNNGSATNILVKDKRKINIENINQQLEDWLKIDYGYKTCQPHYSHIKPLILAEEFLVDEQTHKEGKSLLDYKFYCINGEARYVFVYSDRVPNSHIMKRMIYDMNWIAHPEYLGRYTVKGQITSCPSSFSLMKEMANVLSHKFPFVRVDFYEINGKPIFGEMTFTPGHQEASLEFLNMLGKELQ